MSTLSAPAQFHVLAKPTGAICNLDCKYCFFLSEALAFNLDRVPQEGAAVTERSVRLQARGSTASRNGKR